MAENFPDEVLSAYLDGELSVAEAHAVEEWLSIASEAQKRLDELRRVSALVRDLPAEALTVDLVASVMQQAERSMLLPRPAPPARASNAGRWVVAIGAPLATAAGLLAIVHFSGLLQRDLPHQVANLPPAGPSDDHELADRAAADNIAARSVAINEKSLPAKESAAAGALETTPAPPAAAADLKRDPGSALGGRGAAPRAETSAREADSPADAPQALSPPLAAGSTEPELKAQIDALLNSAAEEKLPVVQIYVVDRMEGMALVQMVLERNDILADETHSLDEAKAAPATVDAKRIAQGLYVVATPEQLVAAFRTLRQQRSDVEVKLAEPIEVASLDPVSQADVEAATPAPRAGQVRSSAEPAKSSVHRKETAQPPPPGPQPQKARKRDSDTQYSRQLVVKLRDGATLPKKPASDAAAATAGKAANAANEPGTTRRELTEAPAGAPAQSLVRVLILFEQKPGAEKKAEPARNKPAADGSV